MRKRSTQYSVTAGAGESYYASYYHTSATYRYKHHRTYVKSGYARKSGEANKLEAGDVRGRDTRARARIHRHPEHVHEAKNGLWTHLPRFRQER